ncbi:predicted protein [Naegleria gruberi]|uniref:Predicted protein n=1 Tax=Naegleria gruberi TaxID=5762 RepID=D2W1B7_NAEGR|nr:uncharacterized protein NAEGRDRAFT_75158 [Naegleria gruberi]EFC37198.1 predicted protein [Naegleria gruberi]|eukprot:XP_002669942.1 predicted protein [Naegleria gruberi strain NEG-M]
MDTTMPMMVPSSSWREPVIILLDDLSEPCKNSNLYSHNINFHKLRKFRLIDQLALFKKKMEYIECLKKCEDNYSVRCFVKRFPLIENNDFGFMKKLIMLRGWLIRYASQQLTSDRQFMMSVVKEHQVCFRSASKELRSDRELLEAALDLSECGNDLQKVRRKIDFSDEDELGIVGLFRFTTRIFKYVTCEKLRNDTELKKKAKEIKSNRELVLQAVKYYGSVLRYSNSKFKADPEIVGTALENGELNVCKWIKKEIYSELALKLVMNKDNNKQFSQLYQPQGEEFWRMVVEKELLPPSFIPKRFFTIKEVVRYAKDDLGVLKNVFDGSFEVDDEEILQIVTRLYPKALKYASERLRSNLDLILPILKREHELIEFVSKEIRNSISVAKELLSKNGSILNLFGDSIRKNAEFIKSILPAFDLKTAMQFPKELRSNHHLIELLVRRSYTFFKCATLELRDDFEFVKQMYDIDWRIIEFASDNLKNNSEFMRFATSRNALSFANFSRSLRGNIEIIKECVNMALKQGFREEKVYEMIICRSFGKDEFKTELVLLHQQLRPPSQKKPSLQYAHPMLFFDREYFISIYGDHFNEKLLDYYGEYALYCMDPCSKSVKGTNYFFCNMGEIYLPFVKRLQEASLAYFNSSHVNIIKIYSGVFYPYDNFSFEMLNYEDEDLLDTILTSCGRHGRIFAHVDPQNLSHHIIEKLLLNLNDDTKFMLLILKNSGSLLKYASDRIRDTEEIVKLAVSSDSTSLAFASNRLRNDKDIVRMAVSSSALNFAFASEELRSDYDYFLSLITPSTQSILLECSNTCVKSRFFIDQQNKV